MIKQLLQQLAQNNQESYSKVCTVTKVDGLTCDVSPLDGSAEIYDVRLCANPEAKEQFVIIPKVQSYVVVSFLTKDVAYVSLVEEVEQVLCKIGDVEMIIDSNGYLFKKGTEDLKKLMGDLLDAILNMVFTTNSGPTINLVNAMEFQAIKTRLNKLLQDAK